MANKKKMRDEKVAATFFLWLAVKKSTAEAEAQVWGEPQLCCGVTHTVQVAGHTHMQV